MKKILLSLVVIISFLSYAFYFRVKGNVQAPLVPLTPKNQNLAGNPTSSLNIPSPAPTVLVTPTPKSTNIPTLVPGLQANSTAVPILPTSTPTPASGYKDGSYTGLAADAFYGNIQVKVTINNGKISDVQFLQAPNDRGTSIEINSQADPILAQEAIQAQSANVDIVSGATDSSQAFIQSLQDALKQAKS